MKVILFLFFLIIATSVKAFNYYFSSVSGDDQRTFSQARNPASPWKTLDKLNLFFNQLRPGDSVLLKRGETFYGSIIANISGVQNMSIVIGAYGSGNKPVITGMTPLSWTPLKKNIYESRESISKKINVLTVNKSLIGMGRYPNTDYLRFESHSGTSSITDNELTDAVNWTSAELVLRRRRWILDRNFIINHTGNTITYKAASDGEPYDKYGYFIQNSPLTLDKQNEWYYDTSTNKIQIYSSALPNNVVVASIGNAIKILKNNYITIDNIRIEGFNANGISIDGGRNILIKHCDILFTGEAAVRMVGCHYSRVENCTIRNSLNNAIFLGSSHNDTIVNNLILNTSLIAGMGGSGQGKGIGIYSLGDNNYFEYNRIVNTGYIGIHFGGNSTVVKNNFIDSFCVNKDDGAGIYTYVQPGKSGRKVIGNIVMNGIGAPTGVSDVSRSEASGIYIDMAENVEITGNTVANCNLYGIYVHSAASLIVRDNLLFNNHLQLAMIQKSGGNKLIRNNTLTQNIFFSGLQSQSISNLKSREDDTGSFGVFDSNYYVRPLDNKLIIYNNYQNNAKRTSVLASEADAWKEFYTRENAKGISIAGARQNTSDNSIRFEYNPAKTSKTITLDRNYIDAKNKRYTSSITLQPYTSVVLIKEK